MFKKIALALLPFGVLMTIISRVAQYSLNDAVTIGGILLILPSAIWLAVEIYKKITSEIDNF
ncbi:MAG: hypothetical protein JNM55_13365 [Anaerolineales bacterium]|nr:hypothetical protein [Anaerolineales bacterium]